MTATEELREEIKDILWSMTAADWGIAWGADRVMAAALEYAAEIADGADHGRAGELIRAVIPEVTP